jgi:hypothetical protein
MKRVDNFGQLKKEIEQESAEMAQKLSLWRKNTDPVFERQIYEISRSINLNLKRIEESMMEAEGNLQRSEVSIRRDFIYDAKQKVNATLETLSSKGNPFGSDSASMNDGGRKGFGGGGGGSGGGVDDQRLLQRKIMADQDVLLDDFHDTVGEIHKMGKEIHITLEDQNHKLSIFNDNVDNVHNRVLSSNQKVDRLLEKANENKLWILIVVLTICLLAVTVISFI